MTRKHDIFLKALLSTTLFFSSAGVSYARNGFIPHFVGSEGIVAGAGTAYIPDATDVISNPAGLTRLPTHMILMTGFSHQNQSINSAGALFGNPVGWQKNRLRNLFLADFGFNIRINEKWAFGFGMTEGGGFVKFNAPVSNPAFLNPPNGNFNKEAVNRIVLTAPTVSYRPSEGQSYGLSLLVAYSDFKTDLANPVTQQEVSGRLSPNAALGFGVRIGGIWDVNKLLTIGMSAATPVYFQKHNKYPELFSPPMQIPATFRFGTAWHLSEKTDFLFDLKGLFYGESRWLSPQGWSNQLIVLTGILHRINEKLTVGCGYNYARPPIGKERVFMNALSIPLEKHHFNVGLRYNFNKKWEGIAMAYYTPKNTMIDNGVLLPGARGTILTDSGYGAEIGLKVNF